ncbi:hypothetical protein BDQ17DRAFT_1203197, partial [Cyathus striatus]
RSYYVPNQLDRSAIEDILFASDDAIRALEAELSNFQSRLSNIRSFFDFHRSLLSPIRELPDELLREIFGHVISGDAIDIGSHRNQMWDLLQVCIRWRNVVQDTPPLWR